MATFVDRMIRASRLDVSLYEEVEADKGAMKQSMAVVLLSGVAAGVGTLPASGLRGLVFGTALALIGWYIWAFIVYIVGAKWLPEPQTRADHGELLRTIGFSSSPGLLRVLGIIPFLYGIVFFITGIWMLVAMVIAVRQALDYRSTWRALGVCVIGWIIQVLLMLLFGGIFGGFGGGAA